MSAYRLLLLAPSNAIGGAERVVLNLAAEFRARGWHVRAVFPLTDFTPNFLAWCRQQGAEAEASALLPHLWYRRTTADVLALRKLVREHQPDVVNIHYGDSHISPKDLLAIRLAGSHRTIVTVHHPDSLDGRQQRTTPLAARLAHGVVAVSEATRRTLVHAGVPEAKVKTVHSGIQAPVAPRRRGRREHVSVFR